MLRRPERAKPAKRQSYNTRLIRRHCCYEVQEVAELYGIHKQAVRNWLRGELRRIDGKRPVLIHGGDLIAFLDARQSKRKCKCAAGEIYCCRCRVPRRPEGNLVSIEPQPGTRLLLTARCGECGTPVKQIGSVRKLALYRSSFSVQTTAAPRINARTEPGVTCHFDEEKNDEAL